MLKRPALDMEHSLERVLQSVISRSEPIMATSPWGGAVILPAKFLAPWVSLINELLALNDPESHRVDAGAHTSQWDSITDLYDSDLGTWAVRTVDELLIFRMEDRQVYFQKTRNGATPTGRQGFDSIVEVSIGVVAVWSTAGKDGAIRRTSGAIVSRIDRLDESDPPGSESRPDEVSSAQFPSRRFISIRDAEISFTDLVADVASRGDQINIRTDSGGVLMIAADAFESLAFLAQGVRELFPSIGGPIDITDIVHVGQEIVELRDSDHGLWLVQTESRRYVFDLDDRTIHDAATDEQGEILFDRVRGRLPGIERCRVGAVIVWELGPPPRHDFHTADPTPVIAITRLDPWLF